MTDLDKTIINFQNDMEKSLAKVQGIKVAVKPDNKAFRFILDSITLQQ